MVEILLNDSIPLSDWEELLLKNKHSTPFQSPEFYSLFNSVKNLSAHAIAVIDSGLINALAVVTIQKESGIKGYFSRRAIIYGGPLINNHDPEMLEILLENISNLTKWQAIYIETRNFSDYKVYNDIFRRAGYKLIPSLNFQIDTTDFIRLSKSVSPSRLRQIKKAQKQNVKWKVAHHIDEVKEFYYILAELYKRKIRKPLFPFEFFENFFRSGLGKYLVVIYKDKIIGGIMCPVIESRSIYEFYICGLDNEYKEQYPSVMATWAAIEYANQNNIPLFDFMGAGKPDEAYGVRDFKARFGGEQVGYGRFLKINSPILYKTGKLALKYGKIFQG